MVGKLLNKIFGSRNDRLVKVMRKTVAQINDFEPTLQALTDEQLKAKTDEFRQRLEQGEELNAVMPEAFAAGISSRPDQIVLMVELKGGNDGLNTLIPFRL